MSQEDAVLIAQHYAALHELPIDGIEECRHEDSLERADGHQGARWIVQWDGRRLSHKILRWSIFSAPPLVRLGIEETTGEVYLIHPSTLGYLGNYLRDPMLKKVGFEILLTSPSEYDGLVAEIYCDGKFVCLVNQERGSGLFQLEIPGADIMEPRFLRQVDLDGFIETLKESRQRLSQNAN